MRNIVNVLWNRTGQAPDGTTPEDPSQRYALPLSPEAERLQPEWVPVERVQAERSQVERNQRAAQQPSAYDDDSVETIVRLGQENESLRLMFDETRRRLNDLDRLKSSFDLLVDPFEKNLRTIEGLKVENSGLRTNLNELRNRFDTVQNELARTERNNAERQAEQYSMDQELRITKETLASVDAVRADLSIELNQAQSRIVDLERQLARNEDFQQSLESEIASLREMSVQKDAQILQYEANEPQLRETVAILEGENTNLRETLNTKIDEFNRASRRITEFEHELENTRNRLNHTRTLLTESKNERKAIADQFDDLNARYQTEKSALTIKIEAVQSRATLGERLLTEARNSLISRTEELRVAERRVLELNVSVSASEQKAMQLKAANEQLDRQNRELEQSRQTLIERANGLTKNLKARDSALARLDDRIPVLMGRIDQLEMQAETNRATYQTRLEEMTLALETERMARAVAEGALEMARRERGSLQRELVRSEGSAVRAADVAETVLDLSGKLGQNYPPESAVG